MRKEEEEEKKCGGKIDKENDEKNLLGLFFKTSATFNISWTDVIQEVPG